MSSRGRRRPAAAEEVVLLEQPASVHAPWKHASAFEVRFGVLRPSTWLTSALPQGAADAEAFLSSVIRDIVRDTLSAEQPAAEAAAGAFEHLDALTQELQRCAGGATLTLATRLTATLLSQGARGAGATRNARARTRERTGGAHVAARGRARGAPRTKPPAHAVLIFALAGQACCVERLSGGAHAPVRRA